MKKKSYRMGLWVLYAFSLFCSFHFDWVSQYRISLLSIFSRFFCGMVLDLQEVKMNVTRLFCLLHGNN